MSNPFFDHPILNSPYESPQRHWELDETGRPTQKITEHRRGAKSNPSRREATHAIISHCVWYRISVRLLSLGHRVALSSNSHNAIDNLLVDAVKKRRTAASRFLRLRKFRAMTKRPIMTLRMTISTTLYIPGFRRVAESGSNRNT